MHFSLGSPLDHPSVVVGMVVGKFESELPLGVGGDGGFVVVSLVVGAMVVALQEARHLVSHFLSPDVQSFKHGQFQFGSPESGEN